MLTALRPEAHFSGIGYDFTFTGFYVPYGSYSWMALTAFLWLRTWGKFNIALYAPDIDLKKIKFESALVFHDLSFTKLSVPSISSGIPVIYESTPLNLIDPIGSINSIKNPNYRLVGVALNPIETIISAYNCAPLNKYSALTAEETGVTQPSANIVFAQSEFGVLPLKSMPTSYSPGFSAFIGVGSNEISALGINYFVLGYNWPGYPGNYYVEGRDNQTLEILLPKPSVEFMDALCDFSPSSTFFQAIHECTPMSEHFTNNRSGSQLYEGHPGGVVLIDSFFGENPQVTLANLSSTKNNECLYRPFTKAAEPAFFLPFALTMGVLPSLIFSWTYQIYEQTITVFLMLHKHILYNNIFMIPSEKIQSLLEVDCIRDTINKYGLKNSRALASMFQLCSGEEEQHVVNEPILDLLNKCLDIEGSSAQSGGQPSINESDEVAIQYTQKYLQRKSANISQAYSDFSSSAKKTFLSQLLPHASMLYSHLKSSTRQFATSSTSGPSTLEQAKPMFALIAELANLKPIVESSGSFTQAPELQKLAHDMMAFMQEEIHIRQLEDLSKKPDLNLSLISFLIKRFKEIPEETTISYLVNMANKGRDGPMPLSPIIASFCQDLWSAEYPCPKFSEWWASKGHILKSQVKPLKDHLLFPKTVYNNQESESGQRTAVILKQALNNHPMIFGFPTKMEASAQIGTLPSLLEQMVFPSIPGLNLSFGKREPDLKNAFGCSFSSNSFFDMGSLSLNQKMNPYLQGPGPLHNEKLLDTFVLLLASARVPYDQERRRHYIKERQNELAQFKRGPGNKSIPDRLRPFDPAEVAKVLDFSNQPETVLPGPLFQIAIPRSLSGEEGEKNNAQPLSFGAHQPSRGPLILGGPQGSEDFQDFYTPQGRIPLKERLERLPCSHYLFPMEYNERVINRAKIDPFDNEAAPFEWESPYANSVVCLRPMTPYVKRFYKNILELVATCLAPQPLILTGALSEEYKKTIEALVLSLEESNYLIVSDESGEDYLNTMPLVGPLLRDLAHYSTLERFLAYRLPINDARMAEDAYNKFLSSPTLSTLAGGFRPLYHGEYKPALFTVMMDSHRPLHAQHGSIMNALKYELSMIDFGASPFTFDNKVTYNKQYLGTSSISTFNKNGGLTGLDLSPTSIGEKFYKGTFPQGNSSAKYRKSSFRGAIELKNDSEGPKWTTMQIRNSPGTRLRGLNESFYDKLKSTGLSGSATPGQYSGQSHNIIELYKYLLGMYVADTPTYLLLNHTTPAGLCESIRTSFIYSFITSKREAFDRATLNNKLNGDTTLGLAGLPGTPSQNVPDQLEEEVVSMVRDFIGFSKDQASPGASSAVVKQDNRRQSPNNEGQPQSQDLPTNDIPPVLDQLDQLISHCTEDHLAEGLRLLKHNITTVTEWSSADQLYDICSPHCSNIMEAFAVLLGGLLSKTTSQPKQARVHGTLAYSKHKYNLEPRNCRIIIGDDAIEALKRQINAKVTEGTNFIQMQDHFCLAKLFLSKVGLSWGTHQKYSNGSYTNLEFNIDCLSYHYLKAQYDPQEGCQSHSGIMAQDVCLEAKVSTRMNFTSSMSGGLDCIAVLRSRNTISDIAQYSAGLSFLQTDHFCTMEEPLVYLLLNPKDIFARAVHQFPGYAWPEPLAYFKLLLSAGFKCIKAPAVVADITPNSASPDGFSHLASHTGGSYKLLFSIRLVDIKFSVLFDKALGVLDRFTNQYLSLALHSYVVRGINVVRWLFGTNYREEPILSAQGATGNSYVENYPSAPSL
jgi:hypothetical protein